MSFKQKLILMKTFVESQFEVSSVYEFQTKANSHENIYSFSVWSYVNLWVSNKMEFLCRHLLSLSLKSCKFMSFKQNLILMNAFVESLFEVILVYMFQPKLNSNEDICWVWVWSHVSLRVSNKIELLWRHLLTPSLKLCKFMSIKQKRILMKTFLSFSLKLCKFLSFQQKRKVMKTFVQSHFEVM